ncbi:hypothetical protein [Methylomonas methanica]|uniref:DUF86 domain-containing protein n=1 Tax=Methylomonas methanica TaxID=421 RepID=A0A177MMQ8_METMH|nr:hypothetical protein [Methylomonas methanica]OAI07086.1 hypothetical protein A1332_09425 [Methylomonas methanica]
MSALYLAEYAEDALLALAIASKEAGHLRYTQSTLFTEAIDMAWVKALDENEERAEKVDAFVGRFGRLQDFIGEKLIPRFAALLGEKPKSLLDILVFAERMGWLTGAEDFIAARKLRNLLVHEYMDDEKLFLQSLLSANAATDVLLGVVKTMENEAMRLSLPAVDAKTA